MITSRVAAVAAGGHHRPPVQLLLNAAGAVNDRAVAVAGLRSRRRRPDGCLRPWRPADSSSTGSSYSGDRGWESCPVDDRDRLDRPLRPGAKASSGPRVSMTRGCCGVRHPEQRADLSSRQVRTPVGDHQQHPIGEECGVAAGVLPLSRAHCRRGRPSATPSPATLGDQPDQLAKLGGLQPSERKDPVRVRCGDTCTQGSRPIVRTRCTAQGRWSRLCDDTI